MAGVRFEVTTNDPCTADDAIYLLRSAGGTLVVSSIRSLVGDVGSLVGELSPPLSVEKVGGRFWPRNGGGRSIVCLPEANHQSLGVRPALLCLPGAVRHLNPGVVDGEVVRGHLASESASGRDHHCRRLRGHGLVSAAMQATLPCRKSRSPGRRAQASTAIVLEGTGSEVPGAGTGVGAGAAVVAVACLGREHLVKSMFFLPPMLAAGGREEPNRRRTCQFPARRVPGWRPFGYPPELCEAPQRTPRTDLLIGLPFNIFMYFAGSLPCRSEVWEWVLRTRIFDSCSSCGIGVSMNFP